MKKNYRNLLRMFLVLILLFISSIGAFNYFIDGSNQFFNKSQFERKLTQLLLDNKKILICNNFNDRSLKRSLLETLPVKPDLLIFGSSRTMAITKDLFAEKNFFNASVTAATLADDMALYYVYQKRGWKPKVLIIGLDQWILNETTADTLWRTTFLSEYNAAQKLILVDDKIKISFLDEINGFYEKYSQLISPYYLKSSIKKNQLMSKVLDYKPTIDNIIVDPTEDDKKNFANCNVQLPNGPHLTSLTEELTSTSQADFVSAVDIKRSSSAMKLSNENIKKFESFIGYLVKNDIKVIFYLPPYEPVAYQEIGKDPNYKLINETEKYFRLLAFKYHIQVVGSYDPQKMNLSANDFIDDVHLKKQGLKKIFTQSLPS